MEKKPKSDLHLSATQQNKIKFPSLLYKNIDTVQFSIFLTFFIGTVIRIPVATQNTISRQNCSTNISYLQSSLDVLPVYSTFQNSMINKKMPRYESSSIIPPFPNVTKAFQISLEPTTKTYHKERSNISFTNINKKHRVETNARPLDYINKSDSSTQHLSYNSLNSEIPAKINLYIKPYVSNFLKSVVSKKFEKQYLDSDSHKTGVLQSQNITRIYQISDNDSLYDSVNITDDISKVNFTLEPTTENPSDNFSATKSKTKQLYLYFQSDDYLESVEKSKISSLITTRFSYNILLGMINSTSIKESTQLINSTMKNLIPYNRLLTSVQSNLSFMSPTVDAPEALPLASNGNKIYRISSKSIFPSHKKKSTNHMKTITILGLFEITSITGERIEGRSELAAAQLAIRHINQKNILPGYHLQLIVNDTKCDPGIGIDAFFHALYMMTTTRVVMLLGTACSDVTESLAKVVPYWNVVQVSFGSTSPALSDRQEFPLFYRTVTPDSSHNPARLAFIREFGWDTVTALSQNEDIYSLAVNNFVTELELANITCKATITFSESDFKDQLRILQDLDTRIIIGSFSHAIAPKIFCEVYQLGMYGSDYAWILQGGPNNIWWENVTECSQHQLTAAVEGILLVSSHNSIVGVIPSYSGLTNSRFVEEFELLSLPVTQFAPQTYDAVWAIALALRGAEEKWNKIKPYTSIHQFDYNRKDMAQEFLVQLGDLNFLGISGPVSFNGADRIGISAFYQVQAGKVSKVALFYPSTDQLNFSCPDCKPLIWQDGQVPIAKRVFKVRIVTIEPAAFLSIASLAIIGIILAFAFLAFNLHFRKLKYIKLSSPHLNNMAVVGCILVYTAVILLGLDHATLPTNSHFAIVCTARVYLLSAGFSLAFGSMFTKTYRVHHIFTRSHSGVVKNKLLQDTQLISLICVLLLIDGLIVTLWVVIDPIQRQLQNLTLEISTSDRSVVYQPQVEVCRSQYTHGWLGALYGYKGLLLVVGVYMAWETRHVKIPALNDSRYIGMSVYSVVITSAIVVVLSNLISSRATLAFVTITTLILISTTSTLCLLFVPKLPVIFRHAEDSKDPIMHSMGLKIEYNTRRFVTDDRRELYYRVQVQNRVYRKEITALDLEIGHLKQQLMESSQSSSSSCSDSLSEEANTKNIELSVDDKGSAKKKNDLETHLSTTVGCGIPLLLLSVIPPVIPRASWPSSEYQNISLCSQVTFSSQPKLNNTEDNKQNSTGHEDIQEETEKKGKIGVLARLKNFLGSRSSNNKISSGFNAGISSGGDIASALQIHMEQLVDLVSSTKTVTAASSCNTDVKPLNLYGLSKLKTNVAASSRELHPFKQYKIRSGSGPITNIVQKNNSSESIYLNGNEGRSNITTRKFSLAMCLSHKEDKDYIATQRKVSYPGVHRCAIQHQHSQPILSFKEKVKGSPRFPNKIIPASSANALEDSNRSSSLTSAPICSISPSGYNIPYISRLQCSRRHLEPYLHFEGKCRSLEDATSLYKGIGPASKTIGTSNWKQKAASYSANCDIWEPEELQIPVNELSNNGSSNFQRTDLQFPQNQT